MFGREHKGWVEIGTLVPSANDCAGSTIIALGIDNAISNEHAARMMDQRDDVQFHAEQDVTPGIRAIMGKKNGWPDDDASHSIRQRQITPEQAKKWMRDHGYKMMNFEAASEPARYFQIKEQCRDDPKNKPLPRRPRRTESKEEAERLAKEKNCRRHQNLKRHWANWRVMR